MLTPSTFLRKLGLRISIGAKDTRQVGDEIVGHFKSVLVPFEGEREGRLIDKFLNWPSDPESIAQFTRKYGPLEIATVPGNEFRFHVTDFSRVQRQLQTIWKDINAHTAHNLMKGGSLHFRGGSVSFIAKTLFWYLYMDLITLPIERVKICKRDQCVHPYFIAGHLKQRFCSDECAEEGQRELKKEWWDKNGQAWRVKRRRAVKTEETKNGTKKAR
jgi:hypothetical protein